MTPPTASAARKPTETDRRDRILTAAEQVFAEQGFHATTMQQVAEAAGMSAGNLYRTFSSKEDIVRGLCARDQRERIDTFIDLAHAESMMAAFEASIHDHLARKTQWKARLLLEIWAEATRNPAVAEISLAVDADMLGKIAHVVAVAKERGEAAPEVDPEAIARFIFTYMGGLLKRLAIESDFDSEAEAARAFALVKALCRGTLSPGEAEVFAMSRALSIVILVLALVGGLWAYGNINPCAAPVQKARALGLPIGKPDCAARAADAEPAAPPPPAVTVEAAQRREFVDRLFVSGTLVPREEAQVAARIDGLSIVELDAEDGDWVKQGQVLARLDRSQLDALLAQNDAATKRADAAIAQAKSVIAQSQAQGTFATSDYQRAQKLGDGVMSVSAIQQRETAMKTAEAQLAAANDALAVAEADRKARDAERQELLVRISRTEVRAPVAGLVSRRSARLGAMASSAGEPLFRIIVNGEIDLEADAPEQSLTRFALGMPAAIRLPGVETAVAGHVRLISQEVDRASRTGKVRIALDDVSHAHVGAFASGEVEVVRREGVSAPTSALRREGDAARLYVVRDGRVEERQVKPGIVEGDDVEIRDGLAAGESIVARSAAFLRPGDRVRPMAETTAGG